MQLHVAQLNLSQLPHWAAPMAKKFPSEGAAAAAARKRRVVRGAEEQDGPEGIYLN